MSISNTYPGVYIQELPSPVHSIAAVATSITAFVGYTPAGIDNRAEVIFSFADFERKFGGLALNSELGYAVQQFYLNGGSQAYVVRVPMHKAVAASVTFCGLTFTALSSGSWANGQLLIDVDVQNIDLASGDPFAFNLTISDLLHKTSESFPNVTLDARAANYVGTVVNDRDNGSQLVNISAPIPPPTGPPSPPPVAVTGIVGAPITLANVNHMLGGSYTATTVLGSDFALEFSTSAPPASSPLPVTVNVFPKGTPIPQSVAGLATRVQQAINAVLAVQMPGASVQCSVTQVGATPTWPPTNLALRVNAMLPQQPDAVVAFLPLSSPTLRDAAGALGLGPPPPDVTLVPPTGLSVTPSSSPGTFAAGSYYWVVTATNVNGDTLGSNEVSAALSASESADLSWTEVAGASGYNVYRGTAPGFEDHLIGTSSSGAFHDSGDVGSGPGPLPTATAVLTAPSGLAVNKSSTGGSLPAGLTYWVVTAVTAAGESPRSNEVSANLTGSKSSAALSWTADPDALSYNVYRGYSPGGENQLVVNVSGTPAEDVGSTVSPTANVAHYALGTGNAYAPGVLGGETPTSSSIQRPSVPGTDGIALPDTNDLTGDPAQFTGIYALQKVDQFNLLSIPDATRALPGSPTTLDPSVDPVQIYSSAIQLCDARRAFLLVDPSPNITSLTGAVDWKSTGLGITDSNGAAFWPRLRAPDTLSNGKLRSFAPSGVVAGVYATTDGSRGVWKAPAGIQATLNGVQGMTYQLSDPEQGLLNPLGLNCFRTFPVYGSVVWGARTLAGANALTSQWKYVPVRRMALFLEESLYRGTQWVVFEPNDEPLWAAIRLNVGAFMQTYFLKGAFQGMTPDQAYFVKCDSETTTPTDISNGIVNILVGFAPLQPAEFVVIQIEQLTAQASM